MIIDAGVEGSRRPTLLSLIIENEPDPILLSLNTGRKPLSGIASADNPVRAGRGLAEPAGCMGGLHPSGDTSGCGMVIVRASSSGPSDRHERVRRIAVTADERS